MLWRRYFGDRLMVANFDELDYAADATQLHERLLRHVGIEPPPSSSSSSPSSSDDDRDAPSWRPLQRRRAMFNKSRAERPCPLAWRRCREVLGLERGRAP